MCSFPKKCKIKKLQTPTLILAHTPSNGLQVLSRGNIQTLAMISHQFIHPIAHPTNARYRAISIRDANECLGHVLMTPTLKR
jgi:hypothetical protein